MANVKEKAPTSEAVKLSQATVVGQVVKGSSSSSRYVCLVVGKGLNLAGRINGNGLSVRIEPQAGKESALSPHTMALTELGFTVHDTGYASAHMTAQSQDRAFMGLAAYMMGFMRIVPGVALPLDALGDALAKGV